MANAILKRRWRWLHNRAFYWLRWHVTCYMHRCYTCHCVVGKQGKWIVGDHVNRFYCKRHEHQVRNWNQMTAVPPKSSNIPTIIVGGSRTGKTYRLLQAVLEDENSILICGDTTSAMAHIDRLVEWLIEKGLSKDEARRRAGGQVTTVPTVARALQGRTTSYIYIDNLWWVLGDLLHTNPHTITMLADNALVETPQGRRFETEWDNPYL